MNSSKLQTILEQLNIPVAYLEFVDGSEIPYITFYQTGSNNLIADNKVYTSEPSYNIELYCEYKDFQLEKRLEQILNQNEIVWSKSDDIKLKDEDVIMVVYYT